MNEPIPSQVMTPEEFARRMRATHEGDPENDHRFADELMMETLSRLGYAEGIKVFREMPKWYA